MHFTDVNEGQSHCDIELSNAYPLTASGTLAVSIIDRETGAKIGGLTKKLSPKQGKPARVSIPYDKQKICLLTATFTDAKTGKAISRKLPLKRQPGRPENQRA